jgi:hypothetical protein
MVSATFWAILTQTHLVTLPELKSMIREIDVKIRGK